MSEPDAVIRLREERLDWRTVDDDVVALDGDADAFLGTNRSGAMMWRMLAQGTTRADLAAALTREYGISSSAAARDVEAFLAAAGERGLIAG